MIHQLNVTTIDYLFIHQMSKEWLTRSRITIHCKCNSTSRCKYGYLSITESSNFSFYQIIPNIMEITLILTQISIITKVNVSCSHTMLLDDIIHVRFICFVLREGTDFFSHLSRRSIRDSSHQRAQECQYIATMIRIVRDSFGHQEASHIRETQPSSPIQICVFSNLRSRERTPVNGSFQYVLNDVNCMYESIVIESILSTQEFHHIDRCKITRSIIQEQVFRTVVNYETFNDTPMGIGFSKVIYFFGTTSSNANHSGSGIH